MSNEENKEQPKVVKWPHPFSERDVESWKATYGDRVHLVEGIKGETYVVRGLSRAEFKTIVAQEVKSNEDLENLFVRTATLYPIISELSIMDMQGGTVQKLFQGIMTASDVDLLGETVAVPVAFPNDPVTELTDVELSILEGSDIKNEDVGHWFGTHGAVYFVVLEGIFFAYHGVKRKHLETYRSEQREGKHVGATSEDVFVESAVLYPYRFTANSDEVLHGIVTKLHDLVLAASGFNSTTTVTKL